MIQTRGITLMQRPWENKKEWAPVYGKGLDLYRKLNTIFNDQNVIKYRLVNMIGVSP